ncbi:MAG: BON domain-containing protein [Planctomyces sp.]
MNTFRLCFTAAFLTVMLQLQPVFSQSGGGGSSSKSSLLSGLSGFSDLSALSGLAGLAGLGGGGIGTSTGFGGNTGALGSSTTGTSSTSSRSSNSTTSGFGGNSTSGSMSSMSGGSGQSGLSCAGTSGLNGGQTTNTQAQGFVGGSGAQNFVGGGMQGNSNRSNRQFQAFQSNQGMMNQGMGTTGSPRQIRTALRVNFSSPGARGLQTAGQTAPAAQAALQKISARNPQLTGLSVSLNANGVAVLQGTVPSAEASRLAANLLRLQPGVRSVDNQATVEPAAEQ